MTPKNHSRLALILFTKISVLFFCSAYSQDILWEKSYGGKHAEYLFDAVPTADYGFILAGSSLSGKTGNKTSEGSGNLDYWVWKMDEDGEMEWQKSFGGSGSDALQSIKLTTDGGFILAGNSNSGQDLIKKDSCRGGDDFWIIKLDAGGGEQWQKTIGGTGQEKLQSIYQTKDGGYVLGGSSDSAKSGEKTTKNFGSLDYWVVKLDFEGNVEWQKTFGGFYMDELRSIEQTTDGGYIVGGYSNSPESGNKKNGNIGIGDFWILKLDKSGEVEWEKVIGGDKDDQCYVVHQTYDDGYILGGTSNSSVSHSKKKPNGNGIDFWVVKLDKEGEITWQETYDFGQSDMLTSIIENNDHTFLIGGFAQAENEGKKEKKGISDYLALKISENGERLWDTSAGSDGDDSLKKLFETRDGGYLLVGTSNPVHEATLSKSNGSRGGNKPSFNASLSQSENKQLESLRTNTNQKIAKKTDGINQEYNKITNSAVDEINSNMENSPVKLGLTAPNNPIGASSFGSGGSNNGLSNGMMDGLANKTNLPASGEKKKNFGSSDFWVVKLLDKNKPKKPKAAIEAIPNPAENYTNVIIGYDFESGHGTLVDLAGHILQRFEINSRTVPVDLSIYPEGIYVINITTNKQSSGVKVVKQGK